MKSNNKHSNAICSSCSSAQIFKEHPYIVCLHLCSNLENVCLEVCLLENLIKGTLIPLQRTTKKKNNNNNNLLHLRYSIVQRSFYTRWHCSKDLKLGHQWQIQIEIRTTLRIQWSNLLSTNPLVVLK